MMLGTLLRYALLLPLAGVLLIASPDARAQTHPQPHLLAAGDYVFTDWPADSPAGTYPANMRFHRGPVQDPALEDEPSADYILAYNLASGTRMNGHGMQGFSWLNTGTSGDLGAAVLALNTTGRKNVTVAWTGRTHAIGDRHYAIQLQYRIWDGASWSGWTNVSDHTYAMGAAGTTASFGPAALPETLANREAVQLRWKYHHQSGATGSRPRMGIDEIIVTSDPDDGPHIEVTGPPLAPFTTVVGTASASQSYHVSGGDLTEGITVTAPPGFEVSLDNATFLGVVVVPESGGSASQTVFVRLSGSAPGTFGGDITHTSPGAPSRAVAVSGTVTHPTHTAAVTHPGTYVFGDTGVRMTFKTVPAGGGAVTVTVISGQPEPAPPGDVAEVYLVLTSTMPSYSFEVEITLDVSGIAGLGPDTKVAYYNTDTEVWVLIDGTFAAGPPPTYTFTTRHFTPFAFVNLPTAPYNIFVSHDPAVAAPAAIFPNDAWAATGFKPNDWRFDDAEIQFFIVPEEGAQFFAADIVVTWDDDVLAFVSAGAGDGLFAGHSFAPGVTLTFFHDPLGSPNSVRINASRMDNANFEIDDLASGNQYIATLTLALKRPGHGWADLTSLDFRFNDGTGGQQGVFTMANAGAVFAYLGDVTAPEDDATGDGAVDFEDLILFAGAYWSGMPGWPQGMDNYKVKFDVGPTQDGTVRALPVVDGQIQFEDLVIFSLSYGLSHIGAYPTPALAIDHPAVAVSTAPARIEGDELRVPIVLSTVFDLRAVSLEFGIDSGAFEVLGAAPVHGELLPPDAPAFAAAMAADGQGLADAARLGGDGLAGQGALYEIRLRPLAGAARDLEGARGIVTLTRATLRDSQNRDLPSTLVRAGEGVDSGTPLEFSLAPNFPNPFRGATTIAFTLPEAGHARLAVYDALGRLVRVLVEGELEAGNHRAVLQASELASGTYLYRIEAGSFTKTRRLTVIR